MFLACAIVFAAQPKERKRCNKKCAEITTNLTKLVEQYNLLVQQYNAIPQQQQQLQPTSLDALKKQESVGLMSTKVSQQLRCSGL